MAKEHFLRPLLAAAPQRVALFNDTREALLVSRLEPALDSATRRRGLLGRSGLPQAEALVIAPCNAVHTFGMQFPIDILFVGRDGTVLKAVVSLPRRRVAISIRAFAVIEFAAHHPGVAKTSAGDRLRVAAAPASSC